MRHNYNFKIVAPDSNIGANVVITPYFMNIYD